MAKFYLQSGTLRTILDSPDTDRAALWAVHQAMLQIVPLDDETDRSTTEKSTHWRSNGLIVLDETIRISEIGFDRDDALAIDTFDTFREWHALVQALDRLEKLL